MTECSLNTPFGTIRLERLPLRKRELLRAWDAADEYLLKVVADEAIQTGSVLICNDSFGALSVALHHFQPVNWSDSVVAHKAVAHNLRKNGFNTTDVDRLESLQQPAKKIKLILLKVPKSLAFFEYQLISLRPLLSENSRFLVAGMTRSMSSTVWKLLHTIIGPTVTLRAVKKAKLIDVSLDEDIAPRKNPYPVCWQLDGTEYLISNHANVFSRQKLDIGTRFMVQNLPSANGADEVIDLGCGNGILGLVYAANNSQSRIHFVDESYMAIESARINYQPLPNHTAASFHASNDLQSFDDSSIDLVLCNPPFHQQQTVGDSIALLMFAESARVLKPGAQLWVIGNRHLAYHAKLKKFYKQVEVINSNAKFVILKALN